MAVQADEGLLDRIWKVLEKKSVLIATDSVSRLISFYLDTMKIKNRCRLCLHRLVANLFVYECRTNKIRPRAQGFLKALTDMYKIDKCTHSIVMKQDKFALKRVAHQELAEGR